MDARGLADLRMILGVSNFFTLNTATVATVPGLPAYAALLNTNSVLLENLVLQQSIDTKGPVDSKNAQRKAVTITVVDFITRITAFANETNNVALKAKVSISESKIELLTDYAFYDRALSTQQAALANILALPTYGITAALSTSFLTSINAYHSSIIAADDAKEQHKQITLQIKLLIAKIKKMLTQHVDGLVKMLQFTNVDFYNQYIDVRGLKDVKPSRKLSITGKVRDKISQTFIAKAVVTLTDYKGKAKKTTKKGGFTYKNIKTGTYTIKITFSGYHDVIMQIYINEGVTTKLNIEMTKL